MRRPLIYKIMSYKEYLEKVENMSIVTDEEREFVDWVMQLEKENKELREVYEKTINHLFSINKDELARYMQAQLFPEIRWIPMEVNDEE